MEVLISLEKSALGMWVSSSLWGYPIVLSLHAIGMGVLVGVSLMLSFRALGLAFAVPVAAMRPYWRIAQVGFAVNLISGAALFSGSASTLWESRPFWIKIILVFIGLALTWRLSGTFRTAVAPENHRLLACIAVAAWFGALISGRLIGYMT